MKNQHLKRIAELNLAVLFISTSGVLGRYISMPPPITIWWRCLIAAVFLGAFCWYQKIDLKILNKRDLKSLILSAFFLGAHWITYFYALHLSNVAIAMLSLFTYPVVTALLEPFFFKTNLNIKHVLLGIVVLIGIYFLTPELNLSNNITKGVIFGLISSVFYALRNILSKKNTKHYHGSMIMFYQLVIVSLILWPVLVVFESSPTTNDWKALITLALLTTAIGHTLFVMSFNYFTVSTASIMSSAQAVYGILFGILFLNEIPSGNTMVGGALIITTVVIENIRSKKG